MYFEQLVEQVLNGLAKGETLSSIAKKHSVSLNKIQKEHKKGISVEFEHTGSKKIAAQIALDHLFEDPSYYTKLSKMEKG